MPCPPADEPDVAAFKPLEPHWVHALDGVEVCDDPQPVLMIDADFGICYGHDRRVVRRAS